MLLLNEFQSQLDMLQLPPGRALVAVSGGPDSVALLDLLNRTRDRHRLELVVAHFDHGIHPDSRRVAEAVAAFARSLELPHEAGHAALGARAGETSARAARYGWLEATRVRLGAAVVFTAHHAEDQAETVLMRTLAGSGPAGLAGMSAHAGNIVRPLLRFRREAVLGYVRARELPVWHDPANQDPRHLRSWLRCDVLPALRARLPDVDGALLSIARHAARDRAAWDAALDLLPGLDFRREHDGFSVAAAVPSGYDSRLGATVLSAAARRVGCRLGPARAGRLLRLTARGMSGAMVELGEGWAGEIVFGRLLVARLARRTAAEPWILDGSRDERAWGRWLFRWSPEAPPPTQERVAFTVWLSPAPLAVRRWTAGERLRPLGGTGRRLLVRCFQDARVPRSRRADWPVLAGPEGIVWVPGVCRSDALLPQPGTESLRIDAEYA
jgi:tRNA(Ile)-lysidine synthase